MDTSIHNLTNLFKQLGLPDEKEGVANFIDQHSPLDPALTLVEAPFWNVGQREFLLEALAEDSDWSEFVEQLDVMLRK